MNKVELKKEIKALGIVVKDNKIKKSDARKIVSLTDGLKFLMQVLYRALGNKRYLHDLEVLLKERLAGISANDQDTLFRLARDIEDACDSSSKPRHF